jgi:hypothetical protein
VWLRSLFKVGYQAGRWRFVLTIVGVLLVFAWIAYAVIENGGPLCGVNTEGYCTHGKVTPK